MTVTSSRRLREPRETVAKASLRAAKVGEETYDALCSYMVRMRILGLW